MSKYNKEKMFFIQTPIKFWYRQDIIWLQSQPDGYQILILYNKLMGLTANMDGYLLKQFGDVKEPYTNEEIAKITMHDLSIVEKGINLLEKVGLLEKIDNAYFIEEALNMTNQTIGAREKQEQRRNKEDKCLSECPPECLPNCPPYTYKELNTNKKTKTNKNKKKEKTEIEKQYSIDETTGEVIETEIVTKNEMIYKNIIDYLNLRLGTNYKSSSAKTKALIDARLNEGFTEDDFKVVIDKKYDEWHDSEMAQYLRPETLFSNKFESYLNQQIIRKGRTLKDISMKEIDMALAREREQKGKEANDDNIRIY